MKKWVVSSLVVLAASLPFMGFALKPCLVGVDNICACVEANCKEVDDPSFCNSDDLHDTISALGGPSGVCNNEGYSKDDPNNTKDPEEATHCRQAVAYYRDYC